MENLTVSQIAQELDVSIDTIKRWYKWWETEDVNKLNELVKEGMPPLPPYSTLGKLKIRSWNKSTIDQLKAFQNFLPKTKGGFMHSCKNKREEK